MAEEELDVRLLVDKKHERVVLAESGKDFVDTLLSFLTLPAGTVVRLVGKRASLGCMDHLYQSVEKLDAEHLQTRACKAMLLSPMSASHLRCENLKLSADDKSPQKFFSCPSCGFPPKGSGLFSLVPDTLCACGRTMEQQRGVHFCKKHSGANGVDGVFVKGGAMFLVTDDLRVAEGSVENALAVFRRYGIQDGNCLEERFVKIGRSRILKLLERSLVSGTPLTDVFLETSSTSDFEDVIDLTCISEGGRLCRNDMASEMVVRLLRDKSNDEVIYAEGGEDFVDLLFSFLTLPLGSLVRLSGGSSSVGSVDNLYRSVEQLGDCIRSENCKLELIAPKLASSFGCDVLVSLLGVEEDNSCISCDVTGVEAKVFAVNPKSLLPSKELGGAYMKGPRKFLVTDTMDVSPFNSREALDLVFSKDVCFENLREETVALGEAEALKLLKACWVSSRTLTDAFAKFL
ncbi:hypothetical protein MUK42_33087 [Musa troglodytarum]|uniref:Uncharacterized protein n=1 Tax=Musa troglodytarum TaxID=320322 RepID=A0A9E7FF04_9LILI|nr:hypothetical protein MUK42_33087 [Musa troglodytarum]